jgi:N6-adenosine-specific RNA methylase IME4
MENKRYQIIYADPPWNEQGDGKIKRGADRHYPLMQTKTIANLPIWKLADDNAHLYLWVTNNFLPDGLQVMKAWGFEYKTMITWVKDKFGLGQYFRGQTEHCLFGVRGFVPYKIIDRKRQQGTTYLYAPRSRHSEKPEEMRQMIEKVSSGNKIELFARKKSFGWDAWGNEIENNFSFNQTLLFENLES